MFQKEPYLWDPVPLLLLLPLHWGLRPQENKAQALSLTAGTLIFPRAHPPLWQPLRETEAEAS